MRAHSARAMPPAGATHRHRLCSGGHRAKQRGGCAQAQRQSQGWWPWSRKDELQDEQPGPREAQESWGSDSAGSPIRGLPPPPPPPPPAPPRTPAGRIGGQQFGMGAAVPPLTSRSVNFLDAGNKWRWPSAGNTSTERRQAELQPQPKSSPVAKRLFQNKELQALVQKDQEQRARRGAWPPGLGPDAQQTQQPPSQASGSPGQSSEMPKPPGFFSSRTEAQEFMAWMEKRREQRMKQMEMAYDTEIKGIALVYLAAAVVIIALGLAAF